MEFLKNLFNGNALTYEQLEEAVKNAKLKVVDISKGDYVSTNKYNTDLAAKDTQINTLNDTIKQRDTDLASLNTKLQEAGSDATKLTQLTNDLTALQSKYDTDMQNYQAQLSKQAYEFAVKEFASTKKFTSNAAKRDFIQSMIAKELKLENNAIIGADDFVTMYSKDNEDAFVNEEEQKQPEQGNGGQPYFVAPTQGTEPPADPTGGFKFDFVGVRPREQK